MNGSFIPLLAYLVLSIAVVLIFFLAIRRAFSTDEIIRRSLVQQLPLADVNYLLSTSSADLNDVQSLVWLAQRIRKIRSPVLSGSKIRNLEIWIIISLLVAELRVSRAKARAVIQWMLALGAVLVVADAIIVTRFIYG